MATMVADSRTLRTIRTFFRVQSYYLRTQTKAGLPYSLSAHNISARNVSARNVSTLIRTREGYWEFPRGGRVSYPPVNKKAVMVPISSSISSSIASDTASSKRAALSACGWCGELVDPRWHSCAHVAGMLERNKRVEKAPAEALEHVRMLNRERARRFRANRKLRKHSEDSVVCENHTEDGGYNGV